jgi:prepilin-type N-terminal cleavage/methylation domain-containing protein
MDSVRRQAGFTLMETLVALAVLLAVGGIVTTGMFQLMKTQSTIANRTDMHTSVRSATELLQQEIGQAGKVSLGAPSASVTLSSAVTAGPNASFTLQTSTGATPYVYQGEVLSVDVGPTQETVTVINIGSNTYSGTAAFANSHSANAPVMVLGAFGTGVVPPAASALTDPNGQCVPSSVTVSGQTFNYAGYSAPSPGTGVGSTCEVLKLYGDINGDGNMVYVEYTCTQSSNTASPGFLYRQQVLFGGTKTSPPAPSMVLLNNVMVNPNDLSGNKVPCFRYQVQPLLNGWVVTDVAVTLTVQTANIDPVTHTNQQETKALLNISPRNVFEVFDTAKMVDPTRSQAMPSAVASLL